MIEKFIPLKRNIGTNGYNELNISIGYQKPQINYFTGDNESGGIYVYIKPVKRARGIVSCTMLSASRLENGFKVKAIEMNRNNRKKVERFSETITDDIAANIRTNYEAQMFDNVVNIIKELGKNFNK